MTKKPISKWLKNEPDQVAWAVRYLRRAGETWLADAFERSYGEGVLTLEARREENSVGEILVAKMRGAWYRQVSNRKNDKSTCSYSLEQPIQKQLDRLAHLNSSTKSATLTALIIRGFDFEVTEREERRKAIKAEVERLRNRRPIRSGPDPNVIRLKREIATLNQRAEARKALMAELLYSMAEHQVMRQAGDEERHASSADDIARVKAHHKSLTEHYENILTDKVGNLAASSAGTCVAVRTALLR
jgi:hypothetical protein